MRVNYREVRLQPDVKQLEFMVEESNMFIRVSLSLALTIRIWLIATGLSEVFSIRLL